MAETVLKFGQELPTLVEKKVRYGQIYFVVNFNPEENEEGWRWLSVEIPYTWDKGKLITSIVRAHYSDDDVEAIISNVLNDPFNIDRLDMYREFQQWRKFAKDTAKNAFNWANEHGLIESIVEEQPTSVENENIPDGVTVLAQGLKLLKSQAIELPDEKASQVPALFPTWESKIGEVVFVGERLFYGNKLWKVLQEHTVQENWTPDVASSLFTEVVAQQEGEPEIGSLENPIPYNGNMELEEGKYYIQDGVVYRCIRSSGIPLYNPLNQLVGLYVEIVN